MASPAPDARGAANGPIGSVDLAFFGRYARFVDYPSVDDSVTSGIDQARRGRFAEHHASAARVSAVGALRVAERHRQGVRQGQVPAACVVGFVVDNRLDRSHAAA